MRASKRRFCSSSLTSSQNLIEQDAGVDDVLLDLRAELEEALGLLLRAEAHHGLDAGAVVPAAIEDHDLAGRGEVRHVALDVHLALLAVGRARAARRSRNTRGLTRSVIALMRAALAGGVAPLEDHDHAQALLLDPLLEDGRAPPGACAAPSRTASASSSLLLRASRAHRQCALRRSVATSVVAHSRTSTVGWPSPCERSPWSPLSRFSWPAAPASRRAPRPSRWRSPRLPSRTCRSPRRRSAPPRAPSTPRSERRSPAS